MKKIISVFALFIFVLAQSPVFADEIIDSQGNISSCKIETVVGGLVEYKKGGNLYSFQREKDQPVFNDYIDVRTKFVKRNSAVRYSGKIIIKDAYGVRLRNENGDISIPWYRVKFVGVYKPD